MFRAQGSGLVVLEEMEAGSVATWRGGESMIVGEERFFSLGMSGGVVFARLSEV